MSRPWPPDTDLERRRARVSLVSPVVGVLVGDVVILVFLVVGHIQHRIWVGSFFAVITVLSLGAFWWAYQLRKLSAIKKAAARED
jgi:hypothetical protein